MRTTRSLVSLAALLAACGSPPPARDGGATSTATPGGVVASSGELALPWPDLATPPATSPDGANDAALLIGVEDYVYAPKVSGASKNATDWFTYLVDGRKVPIDQVKLVRNAEATREGILARAGEIAALVKPGGTVWVVFIGHGAPSQDQAEGVLVGADAQQTAESLYARSVKQSELLAALGSAKAVMVLDACFSGRGGSGAPIAPGLQPFVRVTSAVSASMTLLTAGKGNQFAGPLPGLGRPAFSYLVLGAVRGWGDANGDGTVTAEEAVAYAQKALAVLPIGRLQTPERIGGDGALALSHKATERGPDLTAMVAGAGAGAARGGAVAAGFGAGLGAVTTVPTVGEIATLSGATSLAAADVALLDLLQAAKRADKAAVSFEVKAAAWGKLAAYAGANAYKDLAEKRQGDWMRAAQAEVRRKEQVAKVCAQHTSDSAKLAHLVGLDEDIVSAAQKEAYRNELARAYAPFTAALGECAAATGTAVARAPAASGGMARIPAGTFSMGSNDGDANEKPVHAVQVVSFEMDVTEVTDAAYGACVSAGRCAALRSSFTCNFGKRDRANHPVNCVDWNEATAYCAWAGKRLPSEEEWEYAARGTDGRKYPWGNAAPSSELCWKRSDGTCAVGSFASGDSPFGLHDMAGNVGEWTSSAYCPYESTSCANAARVYRGGGWSPQVTRNLSAARVRAAYRGGYDVADRLDNLGFRCAR